MEIRRLSTLAEFREAVRLQQVIWGFEEIDLLPLRLFVVASKIGGEALGAYHGKKMAGFSLCIPGLKPGGKPYLHSHMMGVLPEYRNRGVGRKLKLAQRTSALAGGIDLIEWTFDPLELKNAFFNIERLGGIMRRYVHNQYGTTSSPLHGGLPTDRLVAEWWIRTPRVEAISGGQPFEGPQPKAKIAVPVDITELRRKDPERARQIQAGLGEQFDANLKAGLAVIGFEKGEGVGTYLLGEWESK